MSTLTEYTQFMQDKENLYNCDNCPENHGHSSYGGHYPCGRQTCLMENNPTEEIETLNQFLEKTLYDYDNSNVDDNAIYNDY